jgi:hypothetical protein
LERDKSRETYLYRVQEGRELTVSTCEGIAVEACCVITGGNLNHSSYSSSLDTEWRHKECALCMQSNQGIHLQNFCRVCITKNFVKLTLTDSAMYKNNIKNCGKNTNNRFTAGKTQNT